MSALQFLYILEVESIFSSESPSLEESADEIVEVVDSAVELLGKQPKDSRAVLPNLLRVVLVVGFGRTARTH